MSYLNVDDPQFTQDLLRRKEFYQLKSDTNVAFREKPDELAQKHLKLHSQQLFIRTFMSPDSGIMRIQATHGTGTGKTISAIGLIIMYITLYSKMYNSAASRMQSNRRIMMELDRLTPSVFVLGFGGTKAAFMRDLLKYPEFGYITIAEHEELLAKQKEAKSGLISDIKSYKDFKLMLRRRITNKSRGGFFRFYGYDEFVNRLFSSDTVKLTDLETMVLQKNRENPESPTTLEEVIREHILNGKIKVNKSMLVPFENSLMICDEVHNTYNMNMKNNRGVAIQYVLDMVPTLRFISLSATPVSNSPTEIIDIMNYLLPADKKITKREFFANSRELRPGKLEELGKLSIGRISFLQDSNVKYFPAKQIMGEQLILPKSIEGFEAGCPLPYLKFIPCKMSALHQNTLTQYIRAARAEGRESIPTDGYTIYDMVFPNPESSEIGLFRSSDIKNQIAGATQEWKTENQIYSRKYNSVNSLYAGEFLTRGLIGKYSTKFARTIDLVQEIIGQAGGDPSKCGKIMIYHDRVKTSGVLLVQELLKANGFVDETTEPTDNTICAVCGRSLKVHSGDNSHDYKPARFVVAHSDIDKPTLDQSLAKYDSPTNIHGLEYMILIGSKIIKESYDFKGIQNLILLSMPANIPTMIQVFGRAIRKYSHADLPPAQRIVKIHLLISIIDPALDHDDPISPELARYAEKIADYMVIQKIEREINKNAIDADINRDINMSESLRSTYFPPGEQGPVAGIGNLYYDPEYTIPTYTADQINLSTFTAYKHFEAEINTIKAILKRLFIDRPVWKLDDLWAAVRAPPFGLEINPMTFDRGNFIIALSYFITESATIYSISRQEARITEKELVHKLYDPEDKYIYKNGEKHRVKQIGEYYILFPIITPVISVNGLIKDNSRDRERSLIKMLEKTPEISVVDVDSFIRWQTRSEASIIGVDRFIQQSRKTINYEARKRHFADLIGRGENISVFLDQFTAQFQMSYVEEAIIVLASGEKLSKLQSDVIALMGSLDVLVTAGEVMKYKDVAKQFSKFTVSSKTPVGYMAPRQIRIYDPEAARWKETSRVSMNRLVTYKENDIIIGYLDMIGDELKFKLRKPVQRIKSDTKKLMYDRFMTKTAESGTTVVKQMVNDTRLIEKGIVCVTKNKQEILTILSALGVPIAKLAGPATKIRPLCETIKNTLIDKEIKERERDSRTKYFYGWWDELVELKEHI